MTPSRTAAAATAGATRSTMVRLKTDGTTKSGDNSASETDSAMAIAAATGTNELADDEADLTRTTAKPPRVAPAITPSRRANSQTYCWEMAEEIRAKHPSTFESRRHQILQTHRYPKLTAR